MRAMLEFVAFKPQHLAALRLQAVQQASQGLMSIEHGRQIDESAGRAFTALLDGRPIGCAGVMELWPGRGYGWAYISDEATLHFRRIHRYALKALSKMPWRRIEAAVDVHHARGARWVAHLGFEFEGVARAWTPDGRDIQQWARVAS